MLLNARHSAPTPDSANHPAGPCQHTSIIMLWMLWEKVDLPRPPSAHNLESGVAAAAAAADAALEMLLRFAGIFWQECFYIKPDSSQTRPGQTRPETQRDPSQPDSCQSGRGSRYPLLPACCHWQRFRFWQFVSNLALIFHTGHRKLKCSHNGKSLACQKWRQFSLSEHFWAH